MLKTKNIRASVCVALAGVLNLAGCGQTGPLYLPPKMAQAAAPSTTPAIAAALPIIAQTRVS
jgi:predicted small lipoprotein YifL